MRPTHRPRVPISIQEIRPRPAPPRHGRLHGQGRRRRRQRRHGIVLRPAAEQRPQPRALDQPRPTADRDRDLYRTDLPPPQTSTPPRPVDPHRVRNHHDPNGPSGRVTEPVTYRCSRPSLEPPKPKGGPGDLRAVRAGSDVFIEVRVLGPDRDFLRSNHVIDKATVYLVSLEHRHDVHWNGDLPGEISDEWKRDMAEAAARVAATGQPVQVITGDSALTVLPGPARVGTRISGPLSASDQHRRLLNALGQKAVKTESAGAAWLWLEDAGALWPFTPFAQDRLATELQTLRQS